MDLFQLNGRFTGSGLNHEGQPFHGAFDVRPVAAGKGLAFTFDAIGDDRTPYHLESSLIGKNPRGELVLYVVSSNHPGAFERILRRAEATNKGTFAYVFGFGDPQDKTTFREEILLEIGPNTVRYVYFWGMPGGDFAERSGCRMRREP